jgi:hypothetical protein
LTLGLAASGRQVAHRIARPTLGWRLRVQPEVAEDRLDDRPLEGGRDDLEFPKAAVRPGFRRRYGSRIHRKPPDQVAPNRRLLNTRLLAGHCRPTGSIVRPQFTALRPFKLT